MSLYDISSRLLTRSVARVFYHTRALDVEVNPEIPRKQSKAVSKGNGPVPYHDEFGSDEPTMMADLCQMLEENFDRQLDSMKSHFDRQDKKLGELTKKMRATNQRLLYSMYGHHI